MRAWMFAAIGLLLLPAISQAADVPPPTGDTIVAPDAKLELLFTRTAPIEGGLTEGPAVAKDGSIYFSDIPMGSDKGMILRYNPKNGKTTVFAEDSQKTNGLIFNRQGDLLACQGADGGGRQIMKYDVKTGHKEVIATAYDDMRFNAPNDLCLDARGRIYFTDPRYVGDEPRELEHRAVYRIAPRNNTVVEITHDISKPNGIAISPDGKTLYVAEHDNGTDKIDPTKAPPKQGDMKIYAFPLNQRGRVEGDRRTLVDFGDEKGCDGMCVDEQGNLYLTVRSHQRPGVLVVNPDGKQIADIPTGPANQPAPTADKPTVGMPSNVEFGIEDQANILYITVDKSLYRIPLKVKGLHVQYQPRQKKNK